jgi:hypothetical protein
MPTGPYGRQWISPRASAAFSRKLLDADRYCIEGNPSKSLSLYRTEAHQNHIARRRLAMARKQLRKHLCGEGRLVKEEIGIGFVDWYPGFDKDSKGILDLFDGAGLNVSHTAAEDADVLVAGCYGNQLANTKSLSEDKLVIFFSGENISPSYDIHDFSITTRSRNYCGKNVRYPQWLGELCLRHGKIYFRDSVKFRQMDAKVRNFAISAVYNNATPEREEMLSYLRNEFGNEHIHVFGSQRTGEVDKLAILSRSVINLCFENSLGEGYVTEKLLHARMMGCKALYWGDSSYSKDFRDTDIFNTRDADSFQTVAEWCRKQLIKTNPFSGHLETLDPALFCEPPSYKNVYQKIFDWAKIVLAWRY